MRFEKENVVTPSVLEYNLKNTQIFLSPPKSLILTWTTDKHTEMTTENSKGKKDASASNVSHVSRKPLQCIHITTPYAGHIVEVTSRNHSNAYDLFSNTTRLSSSLFSSGENNVTF